MLIINLIVRKLFDDIGQIRILENQNSLRLEQDLQACSQRRQILNVTDTVGGQYDVRLAVVANNVPCSFLTEKSADRIDALIGGERCYVAAGLHSEMAHARECESLEQSPV